MGYEDRYMWLALIGIQDDMRRCCRCRLSLDGWQYLLNAESSHGRVPGLK